MREVSVADLWLLPTPKHVDLTGGWAQRLAGPITASGVSQQMLSQTIGRVALAEAVSDENTAWLWCRCDTDVDEQGYRLEITPWTVCLSASAEAGLRNGLHTVAQLLRRFEDALPTLRVEDEPSFAVRGAMLDVSRGRVPTMQQLFETVDVLSSLKVNHLQLYTEHTFAYAGHEEVWHGCSPVTPDEVRQLDHYCEQRGVELAANQNCFGHLARWLKLPRYAHLAETHGDFPFLGQMRRGPFSLCPIAPGSIALVDDLLSQLLPCFRSKRVNVGCDETFDVGFGRSREAVELHGRAAVYFKYVAKVAKIAERLGKWPMFWADMALAHPDSIDLIPASMTALVWGYEANSPFERSCRLLRDLGREAWVCPGTSSWRSIVGRTSVRRANLTAAARQGWIAGAAGCLVTDWGDLGHYQQWPTSLHGLAEAAATAWNTTVDRFDPRTSGLHAFGDATGWVGLWLDELGDVDAEIRDAAGPPDEQGRPTPLRNASALFTDLHEPIAEQPMTGDALAWERVRRRLEALGDHFPIGLPALLADELQHTLAVAQLAADRAVARRMERGVDRHVRRRFAVRLDEIIAEHRRLWLQRCREGGLDESCSHYQTIAGGD